MLTTHAGMPSRATPSSASMQSATSLPVLVFHLSDFRIPEYELGAIE